MLSHTKYLFAMKKRRITSLTVNHSSFPVIHKVDKVGIFVQILMRINYKWLPQEVSDYYINVIFKVSAM